MSRCFPFPPPGYESTARSEPLELLTKEKHKDRKRKRDKKDGEKKDKDRSKDKHKDKKDRKEKHRDKKKEKDKEKDKSKTSDDRKNENRSEGHREFRLQDTKQGDEVIQESKFTEELGRRIRDEEKGASNSMAECFTGTMQNRTEDIGMPPVLENERYTDMAPNDSIKKEKRNNGLVQQVGSAPKIEGMGSAFGVEKESGSMQNSMVKSLTGTDRRNHGLGCTVDKSVGSVQQRLQGRFIDSKEKEPVASKISNTIGTVVSSAIKTDRTNNYTVDKPVGSMQETLQGRFSATDAREPSATKTPNLAGTMVPNSTGTEQRKNYRVDRPVDSTFPRAVESIRTVPALEKERVKSNNVVSYPFDPIEGRNDGIGDTSKDLMPSFHSSTEKGRIKDGQMVQSLTSTEQRRTDGMGGSARKDIDSSMEAKKSRERNVDVRKGERHLDGDRNEKKSKKDKDRHKEKKKEKKERREKKKERKKEKEKGENKHKEHMGDAKSRDNGARDMLDSSIKPMVDGSIKPMVDGSVKAPAPQKNNANSAIIVENFNTSKDIKMNNMVASSLKPLGPQKNNTSTPVIVENTNKSNDIEVNDMLYSSIKPLAPQKDNMLDSSIKSAAPLKDNASNAAVTSNAVANNAVANNAFTVGNSNKRKDAKMNGFLHENVPRPNKIMRTSLSSNLPVDNGRTLEPYPIAGSTISHGPLNAATARVPENKEHKSNGIKDSRPSADMRPQVTSDIKVAADTSGNITKGAADTSGKVTKGAADTSGKVTKVAADTSGKVNSVRPPHPDLKYLEQIFSVPKMEEWPEFDDQEWLFSKDNARPKPKPVIETEGTPTIWAEAVQIGDVLALPYVIPF